MLPSLSTTAKKTPQYLLLLLLLLYYILAKKSPSLVSGRQKVDGSMEYPRPRIYSIVGGIMSLISQNKLLPIRPTSGIHHSRREWQQVPGTAPESALWQPSWQVQECQRIECSPGCDRDDAKTEGWAFTVKIMVRCRKLHIAYLAQDCVL